MSRPWCWIWRHIHFGRAATIRLSFRTAITVRRCSACLSWRRRLIANSYWFPDNYAKTALFFSHFYHASWRRIPAALILASDYSSLSGWEKNVDDRLTAANLTLPDQPRGQESC